MYLIERRYVLPKSGAFEPLTSVPGSPIYRRLPAGIWHFYDGRAGGERRIREFLEDFALHKIPIASFAANALHLEIVRLAHNLVTAFQWNCLASRRCCRGSSRSLRFHIEAEAYAEDGLVHCHNEPGSLAMLWSPPLMLPARQYQVVSGFG